MLTMIIFIGNINIFMVKIYEFMHCLWGEEVQFCVSPVGALCHT